MKKMAFFLTVFGIITNSCYRTHYDPEKSVISVSIYPEKYFLKKIAANEFIVNVMIPNGASPVTYEPTPVQMSDVAVSTLYYKIGDLGFEKVWMKTFEESNPNLKIIDLSKGLELEENSHKHGDHDHSIVDPHIWMSPKNASLMCETIANSLIEQFPDMKSLFEANLQFTKEEFQQLDSTLHNMLDTVTNRSFMIFHPALTYFVKDYNLEQIPIELEGKEPSPEYVKEIIDEAKTKNIRYIFIQKEFDVENAEVIAKEINAEVIQINPLSEEWGAELLRIAKYIAGIE